jgi:hypothetical protein
MHPIPSECPICGGELFVTSLDCGDCETRLEGRFITGPFAHLSNEQLSFVELFIKNEGKINRMEAEMGLSYPTIRNRLNAVIKAMGYELGKDSEGITEEDRRQILEDLNQGKITSEEAMKMLNE